MYCDLCSQYIQVWKLFKGGNYSRAETIRGNKVCTKFFSSGQEFDEKFLKSKHVLKVFFKPSRKNKDFIFTSFYFACLAEDSPLKA